MQRWRRRGSFVVPHDLAVARDVVAAGVDRVAARPAEDAIGAAAHRVDDVVAGPAADRRADAAVAAQAQRVVAGPAVDRVAAEAALQPVLARATAADVAAGAAEDPVVARLPLDDVQAAVAAVDLVFGPD